jgi:carbon storage regulator
MLVLTRRAGETIVIADNIEVTVVSVRGNKVRVGIKAPVTIPVVRSELRRTLGDSESTGLAQPGLVHWAE